MRHTAAGIAALGLGGCMVNVPLSSPGPTASPAERIAAYQNLAPQSVDPTSIGRRASASEVILRDGSIIRDPGDLLAVVDANSPTARAARRALAARTNEHTAMVGFAVALFGGGGLLAYGRNEGGPAETALGIGLLVGSLALLGYGLYETDTVQEQTAAAFATFDESLRTNLRICTEGLAVVACP